MKYTADRERGVSMAVFDDIRRLFRWAIRRTARDRTDAAGERNALVLAPHPDDETLGCGALILRKVAAGATVTLVVVTDGRHSHTGPSFSPTELANLRRQEMREAASRLGLPAAAVHWLDLEDGTVTRNEALLVDLLRDLGRNAQADEVYATSAREPHPDHAAVGRAARTAFGGEREVFEYPIWLWAGWPLSRTRRVRSALDAMQMILGRRAVLVRTEGYLPAKKHALDAHESQLRRPVGVPPDRPWPGLPASVLAAAGSTYELFLPVR